MVYTADLAYANHRGYTSWASFADANTIPTATAIIEIRKTANAIVNVAFHNSESDAAIFTTLLGAYEMIVMDRIIQHDYIVDKAERDDIILLTEKEFKYLRALGGSKIKSISMYDKTSPFRYTGGILY